MLEAPEADAMSGQEPPDGYRLILATTNLLESIGTRSSDGRRLSFEWGGPDENGWYVPTITATDDGWVDSIRAEAREQGAAEERARADAYRHLYERVVGEMERVRRYVAGNLAVWSDDADTNTISAAVCDVLQKVLNVIDTGNPLVAAATGRTGDE